MVCDNQISVVLTKAVGLGILFPCEVQQMGQNIVNANCKSLEARYGAKEEMINKHKFVYNPDISVVDFQAHKYAIASCTKAMNTGLGEKASPTSSCTSCAMPFVISMA
jgi:hypothetical protein